MAIVNVCGEEGCEEMQNNQSAINNSKGKKCFRFIFFVTAFKWSETGSRL